MAEKASTSTQSGTPKISAPKHPKEPTRRLRAVFGSDSQSRRLKVKIVSFYKNVKTARWVTYSVNMTTITASLLMVVQTTPETPNATNVTGSSIPAAISKLGTGLPPWSALIAAATSQ